MVDSLVQDSPVFAVLVDPGAFLLVGNAVATATRSSVVVSIGYGSVPMVVALSNPIQRSKMNLIESIKLNLIDFD